MRNTNSSHKKSNETTVKNGRSVLTYDLMGVKGNKTGYIFSIASAKSTKGN